MSDFYITCHLLSWSSEGAMNSPPHAHLQSNSSIPTYSGLQPKFQDEFEGDPERGPLGLCMKPNFENLGLGTFPVSLVDLQKFAF